MEDVTEDADDWPPLRNYVCSNRLDQGGNPDHLDQSGDLDRCGQ